MTEAAMKDPVEGSRMVSSGDVTGTAVYSTEGDHVGDIDHLMIDKESGRIAYAVMSFGGFLGIGADEVPVPWNALHYDTRQGGYVTGITQSQLEERPRQDRDWQRDRAWEEQYHSHFGAPFYWV
ncbi:PRC-barrel domain-containing protein [Oceaniglobus roseus]|uniref:PRC-barrel domain-containing protein n=1 Tax=Oceaniglobus roseus TaxID=1737570 RepID=UPI001FE4C603|nr:PRC-barrel domain-containing protein [Kandeliimicrobium roseum]